VELHLGSLGSLEARAAYLDELKSHLRSRSDELSADVRDRIEINPLRAFDSDDEGTRGVMKDAPHLLDHLSTEDAEHFAEVRELLGAASVEYVIDPTLVRGLDYYTRTIFSFVCSHLGAQSEIGGGGRYDGLIAQLGGPDTPAVGWAAGIERILLALDEEAEMPGMDLFIAVAGPGQQSKAMALAAEFRHHGLSVEIDLAGRSMKGQLKQANRVKAVNVLTLEEDGTARLKNESGSDAREVSPGEVLELVRRG